MFVKKGLTAFPIAIEIITRMKKGKKENVSRRTSEKSSISCCGKTEQWTKNEYDIDNYCIREYIID